MFLVEDDEPDLDPKQEEMIDANYDNDFFF
jgi:hypothetical protein